MLELSERLCMTRSELGVRMSARELHERMALDRVRAIERERAHTEAMKGR
jgi:hypothetical protein